jgi:hypothetical protein
VWMEEKPVLGGLLDSNNVGILTPKSLYARCLSGKTPLTGNPVRLLYARVSRLPRVPPVCLFMRSEEVPLTGAQVNETVRLLFPSTARVQPVVAEMTFDVTGVPVWQIHQRLVYRARQYTELMDVRGKKTVYIGSAKSAWQLRIYDRAPDVVRLELILRRQLLSGLGIRQPDTLLALRLLAIERMFSIRNLFRTRVAAITNNWDDPYWTNLVSDWQDDGRPLQGLCRMLAVTTDGMDRVFPRSRLGYTLEQMQGNLIW